MLLLFAAVACAALLLAAVACAAATTSKEGSRHANYPISTRGGSDNT